VTVQVINLESLLGYKFKLFDFRDVICYNKKVVKSNI